MKSGITLRKIFAAKAAAATVALGLAGGGAAFASDLAATDFADHAHTAVMQTAQADPVPQDLPPAAQGDQTQNTVNWGVELNPLLPYAAIGGVAGLSLLLVGTGMYRRQRGTALRAVFGAAAVTILLNPEFLQENREVLPTEVAVVVDRTASQSLGDREAQTEKARAALMRDLEQMPNVNVHVIEVDGTENGRAVDGSNLFGALDKSLADVPPARLGAVIMLTDGQVHDVPQAKSTLIGDAPVHVMVSGKSGEYDRRLIIDQAPSFGVVDEKVTIRFHVVDEGAVPGGSDVDVNISGDGKILATRTVKPGEDVEVTLDVPHAGKNIISLETAAVTGELTDGNNRVVTNIEGVRERLRVLLVSGEPNEGGRAWRNLLKSDPALDLIHFTFLRTQDDEDKVPVNELSLIQVPVHELFQQKINDFDLIIFDSYQRYGVLPPLYFDNINRYVREGGALMVVAGPDFAGNRSLSQTPIGDVLPAQPTGNIFEQPFKPGVTPDGQKHPVTRDLERLSSGEWGRWFRQIEIGKAAGNTVLEGTDGKPLLVLNRNEKGRVAMLLSDNAWLWARGFEGGGPYQDLLRRVSHWLMQEPALEEEALRMNVENAEIIIERQTMEETVRPVTLTAPSGKTQTVTLERAAPGLWRAVVPADEPGLYKAAQGNKGSAVNVGTDKPREFAGALSTTEILQPVADDTGGRIARITDAAGNVLPVRLDKRDAGEDMAGADWIGIKKSDVSVLKDVNRLPIPGALAAAILILTLAGAWHREGGGGPLHKKETWRRMIGRRPEGPAP